MILYRTPAHTAKDMQAKQGWPSFGEGGGGEEKSRVFGNGWEMPRETLIGCPDFGS